VKKNSEENNMFISNCN